MQDINIFSLNDLSVLSRQNLRAKHPGVPPDYVPAIKYSDRTANGLTRALIDFCRLTGHHAERVANMGRQIGTGKNRKWIPGTGTNGTADIHIVKNGRFVACEIKIGADRQSEAQRRYQLDIERAGGIYLIVKDFEDFLQQWRQI